MSCVVGVVHEHQTSTTSALLPVSNSPLSPSGLGLPSVLLDAFFSLSWRPRPKAAASALCTLQYLLQLQSDTACFIPSRPVSAAFLPFSLSSLYPPPWPPLSLSPLLRCPSSLTFTFPSSSSMGRERGRRRRRLRWRGGGAARGRAGRPDTLPTRPVRPSLSQAVRSPSSFPSPPPPQSRDSLRCVCRASET